MPSRRSGQVPESSLEHNHHWDLHLISSWKTMASRTRTCPQYLFPETMALVLTHMYSAWSNSCDMQSRSRIRPHSRRSRTLSTRLDRQLQAVAQVKGRILDSFDRSSNISSFVTASLHLMLHPELLTGHTQRRRMQPIRRKHLLRRRAAQALN